MFDASHRAGDASNRMPATSAIALSARRRDRLAGAARLRASVPWLAWSSLWIGAIGLAWLPPLAVLRSICLAPLVEETVLRLGVQDSLRPLIPNRLAILLPVIPALVFAAAHLAFARHGGQVVQAAATAIPSWWIGRRYERSGHRLAPCVAWHAGFNLAWLCGLGAVFSRAVGA